MGLDNKTILITRQREQSLEFVAEIEKRGGKAVLLPLISIRDPDSWEELDRALQNVRTYDALIFTSTNGVEKFFQRCVLKSIERAALRGCNVYAVGARTKQAAEERGLGVKAIPESFSSSGLAEYFEHQDVQGKKFLYPRGDLGTTGLIKSLLRQGAIVDPVIVYRTTGPDEADADSTYSRLISGEIDVITFASPSAAANFVKLFSLDKIASLGRKLKIAVVGSTTADATRKLGLHPDIVAGEATMTGLLDAIENFFNTR